MRDEPGTGVRAQRIAKVSAIAMASAFAGAFVLAACGAPVEDDADTCRAVIWGRAQRSGASLSVVGTWNDWTDARAMRSFGDGWQVLEIDLAPGDYGYLVVEEGRGRIDRYQPLSTFRESDDLEVSLLRVPDCSVPQARVRSVQQVAAGHYEIAIEVTRARSNAAIDAAGVRAVDEHGELSVVEVGADTIRLAAHARTPGKHHATIELTDHDGAPSPTTIATAWIDPVAATWRDGIVYQIMIDRFRGDAGAVLDPPATTGSRAGGTLDGVRTELVAGTFDALGVSALWLSPVYVNPVEARPGRFDDHLYEGYHGYWPADSRAVDDRIGGADALHALVADAHARGIRVLLDLVPNHLYETNPRVAEHRGHGWFHEHDPPCVCGSPSCPWHTYIQTCWFTEYLPDLRFAHPDAMQSAIDDAIWWQTTFDTDGARIDAVPMMPRAVTRRIVADLRRAHGTPDAAFTLGEIFTGAGESGTADIRYYMGPDGLDSAFDFPLMWALRDVIAQRRAGFVAVEESLQTTDAALAGSGAVMARMIGNHDVTRFVTETSGHGAADPWDEPAPVPSDPAVYESQALALGLVLTLPGLPVIYYGDEVGLAGGSDPDNRRVMPDLASLSEPRATLLDRVRRIASARRCLPALRSDARTPLIVSDDVWAFVRDAGDGRPAIVLASRDDAPTTITLPPGAARPVGSFIDIVDGERFALGPDAVQVAMPPRSVRVLLPDADPCR